MDENKNIDNQGDEFYEHYHYLADKGQEKLRIDKFLMDRIPNTSRNKIQLAAHNGNILVNKLQVKPNYKVKPNDSIAIVLPYPVRQIELIPQNISVDIIYEDDELCLVNKSANMVVHPGYGNYEGTLVNALLYHFEQLPELPSDYFGRPGLVHRLDKHTTGIMVVAKTENTLTNLAKQFFERTTKRRYHALVWGDVEKEEATIDLYLGRSLKNRKLMTCFPDKEHGKRAVTHYRVIERFGYVTLIECRLETGRTHQIRAHMNYIGHPLFNDLEYGGNKIVKGTSFTKYRQFVENCFKLLPGQALHAKSLGFYHPTLKKQMDFDSELPTYFSEVLEKWRRYTNSSSKL
tara:strand:+ start:7269 stop:8309 length:1041 start_codon:yes stop_codon:yes gene_type:complete